MLNNCSAINQSQLEEMFAMQEGLNRKYGGVDWRKGFTMGKAKFAIMDEVGELLRELEHEWKWWKVNPNYHKQKALFEFIDVIHFGMMIVLYHTNHSDVGMATTETLFNSFHPTNDKHDDFARTFGEFIRAEHGVLDTDYSITLLVELINAGANLLGITDSNAIYQAYIMKNHRNHIRVDSGVLVGLYDKDKEQDLIYEEKSQ